MELILKNGAEILDIEKPSRMISFSKSMTSFTVDEVE